MARRRSFRIGVCTALVAGLVFGGGGTALADCETIWVKVYDLEVEAGRDTYRIGETATIDATVTRKDTGTPAEGVKFIAVVWNKPRAWMFGYEETDLAGEATARIKLKKGRLKPGPVRLRAFAYKVTGDPTTCVQVAEYGEKRLRKAFVVKP